MAKKPEASPLFAAAPLPTARFSAAEKLACLRLIRSENVGAVAFRELINLYGGAQKALDALPEITRRAGRRGPMRIPPQAIAEAELEAAERIGADAVFTVEPGYPKALAAVDAPPPLLYIKGRSEILQRPAVAIVGSRMCSAAGAKIAGMFARQLGEAGFTVVSGLARGIDGAAHRASLQSGTVAVLAGGVDSIYPPEHRDLHEDISQAGCIISEQPPGFKARGQDFPRRNRIISGVSLGVVIVEAAARSGTLVTARYAGEQGREVFAVPGHPLDPRAEGTNRLLKAGATLVTDAEDIIGVLEPMTGLREGTGILAWASEYGGGAGDRGAGAETSSVPQTVPETVIEAAARETAAETGAATHARVLEALGPAPADLDAIIAATGLSARSVQIAVMELDLAGFIARPGPGLIARKAL